MTAEVRQRDHLVPMAGHKLAMQRYDQSTEILCDFYSAEARSDMLVWTDTANRVRINVGSGWVTIGNSLATAGDLGAFTAGETKEGTVEVTIPSGSGSRVENLTLYIDGGV